MTRASSLTPRDDNKLSSNIVGTAKNFWSSELLTTDVASKVIYLWKNASARAEIVCREYDADQISAIKTMLNKARLFGVRESFDSNITPERLREVLLKHAPEQSKVSVTPPPAAGPTRPMPTVPALVIPSSADSSASNTPSHSAHQSESAGGGAPGGSGGGSGGGPSGGGGGGDGGGGSGGGGGGGGGPPGRPGPPRRGGDEPSRHGGGGGGGPPGDPHGGGGGADVEVPDYAALDEALQGVLLPFINGDFEVGIAAGAEALPAREQKLRVFVRDTFESTVTTTCYYLASQLIKQGISDRYRSAMIAAAFVGLSTGCVAGDQRFDADGVVTGMLEPDNGWLYGTAADWNDDIVNPNTTAAFTKAMDTNVLTTATTLFLATKVDWYRENHHVGTSGLGGTYVKKVIDTSFPDWDRTTALNIAHRIGHWFSTRAVLKLLGMDGLLDIYPVIPPTAQLKPMRDMAVRLSSNPAGTARISVACQVLQRMLTSPAGQFCPMLSQYEVVPFRYQRIQEHPVRFHIGARYLCGEREDYHDEDNDRLLGRLGDFGSVYLPRSTLMKSPHLAKYETCEDHSPEFKAMCIQTLRSSRDQYRTLLAEHKAGIITVDASYERLCGAMNTPPNTSMNETIERHNQEVIARQQRGIAPALPPEPADDGMEE